jgi:hypothetical protein
MIERVFDLLDSWRLLPAYQLERRADIFFAIYLPDIIHEILKFKVTEVIPEFPIRIGTIYPEIEINKSYKIDYTVFTESGEVILIELKTDEKSLRDDQLKYYHTAIEKGYSKIVGGIIDINAATSYEKKYGVLIKKLIKNGSIEVKNEELFPTNKFSYFPQTIIIKPRNNPVDKFIVVDFEQIKNIISKKYNDPLSIRFCESLMNWGKQGE